MRKANIFLILFLAICCSTLGQNKIASPNSLTEKEKKAGWILLFNGKNLEGWTSVGKANPPSFGWEIEDDALVVRKVDGKRGGDIITKNEYSDFELSVDYKITEGANSGIKYFFTKYEKGGWLGLEYQILDNERHPDAKMGRDNNRLDGSLYDMLPTNGKKGLRPVGEWNTVRIVAKGTKVTHYVNGVKILSFDRASKEYKKAWEMSKYNKTVPMFGEIGKGHILLQDHGDVVYFRNIKIKEL